MLTSRTLFTWKQKAELWERWKNGQSVLAVKCREQAVARCVDLATSVLLKHLANLVVEIFPAVAAMDCLRALRRAG